ncbi:MAG: serine/threonine protein phosphatase, partial [Bacteroidetes bacterium]
MIGDIHGCSRSLRSLWEKLEPYKDRLHIFVGDYIDRGEDSKGVVEFLLSVRDQRTCVFLRGNHEEMLLNATD